MKPEFFNDRKIGKMGPTTALVYQALWCMADDGGTAICTPELIKGQMFALWPDIGLPEIEAALTQLCESKRIDRYTVGDEGYARILKWEKHQSVHNPSKFRHPVKPQAVTENTAAGVPQECGSPPILDSKTPVVLDTEKPRSGEGFTAPRVMLPPEAEAFLGMFYEPVNTDPQRTRYRDVKSQLFDVLDPQHPGPKIRGGVRSKARGVEHLADTLNAVMKDPPPDRDLAIVWVLKKLLDPPKGPSVTELHKRNEEVQRNLEERYRLAARSAGLAWANANPDEYQKIAASVEATYKHKTGLYVDTARKAELAQRTAQAAGFPSFEKWKTQPGVNAA